MSRFPNWKEEETLHLGFLIQAGFTNVEIAKVMGRNRNSIQMRAAKIYGGNPNYQRSILKHKHLRAPVFQYFLTHTLAETAEHFGLKDSELKSVFTVGYRDPSLKHLRKETRRHDAWSSRELQFLLQHAGLKPRAWIGKKLKRGGELCIKDRLEILGLSSKSLNGITLSQYRAAFAKNPTCYLKTKAGPSGGKAGRSHFKIIPWVVLKDEALSGRIAPPQVMCILIDTMALFQDWIFEGNALQKMAKIVPMFNKEDHMAKTKKAVKKTAKKTKKLKK